MVDKLLLIVRRCSSFFSPLGKIRLGGKEATPDHSTVSWLSMLFAAGMGIGLLFWSVAEPTAYFTDWWGMPLNAVPYTEEAKSLAMGATMFHWGVHGWSIYALVALALAFFLHLTKVYHFHCARRSIQFLVTVHGAG